MTISYVWICGIVSIGISVGGFLTSIVMTLLLAKSNVNLWFWLNSSIHLIFGIIESAIQCCSLPDEIPKIAPIIYGVLIMHTLIANIGSCWAFFVSCEDMSYFVILWVVAIAQILCNIPMMFVLRYVMETVSGYQTQLNIPKETPGQVRLSLDL